MTHSVFESPPHRLTNLVVIGVGLAVVAVVLGAWGMWLYETEHHGHADALSVGYHTLQLFILHAPHLEHPPNWQIHAGRWLAAVFTVWLLVAGVFVAFREAWRLHRVSRQRGHVVVCGLGHLGRQIAKEFLQDGQRVVVIESDGTKVGAAPVGAAVLVGDACDTSQLHRAGLKTAGQLIAVCDDVQTNVGVITTAGQILAEGNAGAGADGKLTSWLFVPDPQLRQLLKQERVFPHSGSHLEVNVRGLDLFALAARQILLDYPLDYEPIRADSPTLVHLVIVGFGPAGQHLALQAAHTCHFADGEKCKVTVLERAGSSRIDEFLVQYPKFKEVVTFESAELCLDKADIVTPILGAVGDADELVSLALCWDSQSDTATSEAELFRRLEKDDAVNLKIGLSILQAKGKDMPRTLLFQTRECGFAGLFGAHRKSEAGATRVRVFGTIEQTCSLDALMHEATDAEARALHEDWFEKERARVRSDGGESKPSFQPWDRLDELYRQSSRHAADHIPVKLRAVGLVTDTLRASAKPFTKFEGEEIELLARMEHARFCAERRLNEPDRKRTDLVPWEDLPESARSYDRSQVEAIPQALERAGLGIYQANSVERGDTGVSHE